MKEFAYIPEEGARPAALQAVPFFNSFSDEQLDDVLNSSNLLQCDVGDAIIKEGTIDSRFYILLSGSLEVRVGEKHVASISRTGEVFGELALVNHDKRLASVVAATKAVCLAVDQKFLQDIKPRDEYPAFYAAMYEFIARVTAGRLQATSRRLAEVELELNTLKEKLAKKSSSATKAKAVVKSRPISKPKPALKSKPRPAVKAKPRVAVKAKRKPVVKGRRANVPKSKRR